MNIPPPPAEITNGYIAETKANYDNYQAPVITWKQKLYDRLVYMSGNRINRSLERYIHTLCQRFDLSQKNVVDIGAWFGYYSFLFASESNNVTAVELSDHIEYAKKRYGSYVDEFMQADALGYMIIRQKKFDFIFCCNCPLHYDTNDIATSTYAEAFINQSLTRLNDKGILYYSFYDQKTDKVAHPVTKEALQVLMSKIPGVQFEINGTKHPDGNSMIEMVIRKS